MDQTGLKFNLLVYKEVYNGGIFKRISLGSIRRFSLRCLILQGTFIVACVAASRGANKL
jgi:hypothetical protein